MIQTPSTMYNPMMQQQMACTTPNPSLPNYNAVKIDIHNPSVNPNGAQQYSTPLYNYQQAPIYNYPVAQQPMYYPPVCTQPMPCPQPVPCPQEPVQTQTTTQQPVATEPQAPVTVQQQNVNAPQTSVPAPVVVPQEQAPATNDANAAKPVEQKPEVVNSTPVTPNVDLNTFIAKLSDPNFEAQYDAMKGIADIANKDPKQAEDLLDSKIYSALSDIINKDTSTLEGPSKEKLAALEKQNKGEKLTDDETKLVETLSPQEHAEANKSYALYTTGILDKVFLDSLSQTNPVPPLAAVPGVDVIVNALKDNKNEDVREAAIETLAHLNRPEYKDDLKTVFTVATKDSSKKVADKAQEVLNTLN